MLHRGPVSDLDALWNAPLPPPRLFNPVALEGLPDAAERFLRHAIADGTPLATAVRLRMHGEIKLGEWQPFTAEQVLRWQRGFVWRARTRVKGLPVSGFDRWLDGAGAMRWKMLGLVPVMTASGPDVSRSARDRAQIETACWLPSALLSSDVRWQADDARHAEATLALRGEESHVRLVIDEWGRTRRAVMERWGNPEHHEFHAVPFGAEIDDEATFGGYTIASRVRVGWWPDTTRFDREGEFFRATIDDASFR